MKVGVDLGGSHMAIGVVNIEKGTILKKNEKSLTNIEKKDTKRTIEEFITENVKQLRKNYEINEIGIGVPGWSEGGIIRNGGNLGIENYPIVERLQEIKLPIKIRNDAKCAALAENKYGCLKGYNRSIFLTLGTGIGGAVFLNNQLLQAGKKPGYEFGHMVIEKNGIPCHCGKKGCFERYASMKVFKNNLRKTLNLNETVKGEQLLERIRKNNPHDKDYEAIENVITEYIDNLSIGIQNLIDIFEPEIIGIGGSFVYFKEILLKKIKEKMNQIKQENKDIKIETAILGNDAGIIGAIL